MRAVARSWLHLDPRVCAFAPTRHAEQREGRPHVAAAVIRCAVEPRLTPSRGVCLVVATSRAGVVGGNPSGLWAASVHALCREQVGADEVLLELPLSRCRTSARAEAN